MQISDLIIEKNNQFTVVNKPAGLPVQPDNTGDKSLLEIIEAYTKHKVYLTHRIDRPATGIVILANNTKALAAINEQFQSRTIEKKYLAIVQESPAEDKDTLEHYLRKGTKVNKVMVVDAETKGAKKAQLKYQKLVTSDRYTLLEVDLLTGRQHQIRAQLANIGSPIKGDVKYGFKRGNRDRSICLHSWKASFNHPVTGEKCSFTADLPEDSLWNFFRDALVG